MNKSLLLVQHDTEYNMEIVLPDVFCSESPCTQKWSSVRDDFELIQQEIAMMQNCQHPNIIQYMGSYMRRDKLWIAMELCGAGSVQDIYCVTGHFSEPQIAFSCVETLKGLAYLHEKNLMHRDIKGANILLTNQGNIKLADFGIAARISETMTKRKSFIGTPYWMAPEMAAVERLGGYDLKCDIWAVGITAIELAELQPPMFDLHPMRALYNIGKRSFVPPTLKEKEKWSPEIHSFIKTSLNKNPKKRPGADRMLTHPFCCHSYTRAVIQDLLDLYKSKSKKGHIGEPDDDDDDDDDDDTAPVDENVQVLTRIRSRKAPDKLHKSSMSGSEGKLDGVQVEPMVSRETRPQHQSNGTERTHNGEVSANSDDDGGTMKVLKEPVEDEPPPLPPKLGNRNSHYQVPQPSMKPVPPPKPVHLKLSRAASAQETGQHSPQGKPRTFSESQNRVPPPSVPPPKPPVGARSSDPGRLSAAKKTSITTCFSKIFNECPLHIYCTGLWMNPNTGEKHIIVGAEEGVYSLNFSEQLHEAEMEQVCAKRCTWLSVFKT
ncbi:Mitogen-activated protein kinase kinase kinase kinase 1 [Desmophyllum pertusum]|uniref:Mitogen-activated protein kinase kinase kinase kinase 1 n=1 Tax=Desmophyllum pertusum TaxID=174260 RepID=A0A9W9ZFI9_9CNID|nr:Mitogen-activated protein kinase kinase kinase kinase 1 [Desmophyllum pertusum]